jgi:adenosylcobinamide-GDP ribazoletransferase
VKGLLLAFQFLTIIPITVKGSVTEKDMARSALFFPLVGLFQGLLASLSGVLFLSLFPPEVASLLVIIVLILTNGGFHLDGLADTFDALAVKSSGDESKDREKRLTVMKDSTTGAIGVVAIVLVVLLKFILLMEVLVNLPLLAGCTLLFLLPFFSKLAMNITIYHGKSARQDGLGRIFMDNAGIGTVLLSFLLTIVLCAVAARFTLMDLDGTGIFLFFAVFLALLYLFSLTVTKVFTGKFGGLTGDTFGAVSELSEILFLIMAVGWLWTSGGESG